MSENKEPISIVPSANFDSEAVSIQLDNSLCLRRIHSNELKRLIQKAVGYRFPLENALMNTKYAIEKKFQLGERIMWTEGSPYVHHVVLALRLLKAGDIGSETAFLLDLKSGSYAVSNTSPLIHVGRLIF